MDLSSPLIDRIISRTPLKGRAQTGRVVLEIDLARGVLVAAPDNPLQAVKAMNAPTMKVLRENLRKAAKDKDVVGLVVHCGTVPLALAQAQELALSVEDFARYKPTLAFAHGFGELASDLPGYTLATACKEIWIQPSGQVGIGGVHLGITLAKGLLAKLGIEPQMAKRHEYKSAADRIAADEVTEANREMTQAIANSLAHDFVETVARRRGIGAEQVWEAVSQSPVTPERALDLRLVDHIGYRDEALAHAFEQWAPKDTELGADQLRFVHRWHPGGAVGGVASSAVKDLVERRQPVVAVVGLRGAIVTGRGRSGGMGEPQVGADVVCEHLRAAQRDEKVKAVVLRIDSPGGSAVASDTIWRAVHQLRESGRPVVAQMGALAASGGYYSAMGADEIVALPATLTGSIGVLAGKMVTTGLYQKLGLVHESVDSGENAAFLADDQHFTDEQWARLNAWLDRIYDEFTHKAAADRGMDHAQLEALARGRVWTGRDAQDRGLVDHLGGMDLAVERACQLAGLKRDRIHLRSQPVLGMLERIRPADSTEQPTAASVDMASVTASWTPEAMLQQLASRAGLGLQAGALEIPRLVVR
ncbi:signal peptide peptidase SppA [Luteococcus sp. Sow4_B9]|uniref:signal peptide peptidase SppA n=1 Tax=Luteococcus sp. Sow4_B9 TaxID=3438792 RepID=UPI003F9E97D0